MSDRIKLEVMADGSVSLNDTRITLGKMWGIQKIVFSKYASKEWIVDALGVDKEIRNKAIDEFAEKLKEELNKSLEEPAYQHSGEDYYVGICSAENIVDEIAEQMKGE